MWRGHEAGRRDGGQLLMTNHPFPTSAPPILE